MLELELIAIKVNIYTMIVINKDNQVKLLRQAPTNDRRLRKRDKTSKKSEALIMRVAPGRKEAFSDDFGGIGRLWAKQYKGSPDALPSLSELFEGLKLWIT